MDMSSVMAMTLMVLVLTARVGMLLVVLGVGNCIVIVLE